MLRRMVYLAIKELSTVAEDVIIVTSSLTKDMTGREEAYCANAIRALCMITDATMLQAIERYMKQAIVDKSHSVSSNALVSSLVSYGGQKCPVIKSHDDDIILFGVYFQHLLKGSYDVVKRWVNEAQEMVSSDSIMVQVSLSLTS